MGPELIEPEIDVAVSDEGRFSVTWAAASPGGKVRTWIRHFDEREFATGLPTTVSEDTLDDTHSPVVARSPAGGGVVAFVETSALLGGHRIHARRFDASGAMTGAQTLVAPASEGVYLDRKEIDVFMDEQERFIVAFRSTLADPNPFILVKGFDADDSESWMHASEYSDDSRCRPRLAGLRDGRCVAAWHGSSEQDVMGVRAIHFARDGEIPRWPFQANAFEVGSQQYPSVAQISDELTSVVWYGNGAAGTGVYFSQFDSNDLPLREEQRLDAEFSASGDEPDAASAAEGSTTVVWVARRSGGGHEIRGGTVDASGLLLGEPFLVNSRTLGANDPPAPRLAMTPGGGLIVVWADQGIIWAQRLDQDGFRHGNNAF